jgi:hypothetical protein
MKRILVGVLAAAGLAAAAMAPQAEPDARDLAYRPVSSAVLVCPQMTGAGQATNVLGAVVTGPAEGPGSAALWPIASTDYGVQLPGPGEPVALRSVNRSQPPILMRADGSWAPSALAGVVARQQDGTTEGLSSAACAAPGRQWWFVGAGSQLGRGAALLVSNAAEEPARFDITLYSGAGPVQALAGKGIDLGPSSSVRLRLDALAPDEELLAIEVLATSGRVAAALRDVAVPSEDRPRGVDFIPPAQAPANRLVIAGIPEGGGDRDLVLVNPGAQFATVTPRLLTESGSAAMEGLAAIAVPAGAIIRVDLTRVLGGRSGTLDLTSDVPVTGGARAAWGGARRDVAWLAAVPLIGGPDPLGGAAVPSGPGLTTTVTVAAPDGEVRGTLTVITTESDDLAVLSGRRGATDGGGANEGVANRGDQSDEPGAGLPELVLPRDPARTETIPVTVPAGSQSVITLPDGGAKAPAGLTMVSWRSEPASGPAAVSHVCLDDAVPLATGYPWWPVASSVTALTVREDLSILAPAG